ncbi:MAG: aspartate 1-decarboxylase [Candidatus Omnitrophica bacterium]|nr:aspartate 1-decarboxylase [Candidatus Omnitrophota bacterium]
MLREMLKSKVSYATITDLQLYYKGSITIDEEIMEKADLLEGEKVEVLNLNNGHRLETYAIKGKRKSGVICLNGPSARMAHRGDTIFILSYGLFTEKELSTHKAKFVELDDKNKIKNTHLA